jgi:hypothetical protein
VHHDRWNILDCDFFNRQTALGSWNDDSHATIVSRVNDSLVHFGSFDLAEDGKADFTGINASICASIDDNH